MTLSDVLVVLSILIAIASISLANNKRLILYKFSWISAILFFVIFIVISGLCVIQYLYDECGCRAYLPHNYYSLWAFFITIVYLAIILIYILKSKHFPKVNNDKIIEYYAGLIETNMPLLLEFVDAYHKKGISNYIDNANTSEKKEKKTEGIFVVETDSLKQYKKKSRRRRKNTLDLDIRVLNEIILTKSFVKNSMNVNSVSFLKIASLFKTEGLLNLKDMISFYFQTLIKTHSEDFFSEIYVFVQNDNETIAKQAEDTKYLKFLFQNDFDWIRLFDVEAVFGECSLKELAEGHPVWNRSVDEWENDQYKKTLPRVYLQFFRVFFKYTVEYRRAYLKTERDEKLFHNYLYYFAQELARNYNCEGETYACHFFEDVYSIFYELYKYLFDQNNDDLVDVLLRDQCAFSITVDTPYLISQDGLKKAVENVIYFYDKDADNVVSKKMMNFFSNKRGEILSQYKAIKGELQATYPSSPGFQKIDKIINNNGNDE